MWTDNSQRCWCCQRLLKGLVNVNTQYLISLQHILRNPSIPHHIIIANLAVSCASSVHNMTRCLPSPSLSKARGNPLKSIQLKGENKRRNHRYVLFPLYERCTVGCGAVSVCSVASATSHPKAAVLISMCRQFERKILADLSVEKYCLEVWSSTHEM